MNPRLAERVHTRLADIHARGLTRTLQPPRGIDLSSNDYLGLANHPRITRAFVEAVGREGVGSTGSRLLRGHRASFAAVEHRFATFKDTPRALYFSSGYLANLGVISTFAERDDLGWITRKKNLICEEAAYSDILVCHDRFIGRNPPINS